MAAARRSRKYNDLISYPLFREMREKNTVFSECLAMTFSSEYDGRWSCSARMVEIVSGILSVVGVNPELGRIFTEQMTRRPARIRRLLSYRLLQRRFAADPTLSVRL